jgi:hypothetical protein
MQWPLTTKIGIGIVAIAIAPYLYAAGLIYSHDWEPLRAPLKLTPGNFQSPEFKTENRRYLAALVFDQQPDFRWEQCMMGVIPSSNECGAIASTLGFDWRIVSNNGVLLKSGSYNCIMYGGTDSGIGAYFAEFQGKRGARQRIVLDIKRDGGKLNIVHPRVVVEPGGEYSEGIPELVYYSLFWAKTVGPLGLVSVFVPLGFKLWEAPSLLLSQNILQGDRLSPSRCLQLAKLIDLNLSLRKNNLNLQLPAHGANDGLEGADVHIRPTFHF